MLEAPIDKYYATLILGLLQMFGSAVCVTLVHYTGKRPLTMFSTVGAGLCCLLVATYDIYITVSREILVITAEFLLILTTKFKVIPIL